MKVGREFHDGIIRKMRFRRKRGLARLSNCVTCLIQNAAISIHDHHDTIQNMNRCDGDCNMTTTKDATAQLLASLHADYDADLVEVFRLTGPDESDADEPIKLLEVNESTTSAGIVPVYFGPSNLIPFANIIVEVTPEEYSQLQTALLTLPDGWRVGESLFSRNGATSPA